MTYELAKQLKDAGFPQNTISHFALQSGFRRKGVAGLEEEPFWDWGIKHGGVFNSERDVACPTLSELIEACGEGFFAISHWYDGWQSEGGPIIEGPKEEDGKRPFTAQLQFKFCHTPEEAIAKLWLALYTSTSPEKASYLQ
jgi:hypothetical protein